MKLEEFAETCETVAQLLERAASTSVSRDKLTLATSALVLVQTLSINLADHCRLLLEEKLGSALEEAGELASPGASDGLSN